VLNYLEALYFLIMLVTEEHPVKRGLLKNETYSLVCHETLPSRLTLQRKQCISLFSKTIQMALQV